ncbi:MAG: hypothetical protein HC835_18235 [Oscillatoriales cyanobacterium RM2_1_1]|nr:hypothetical protein [Oscillatoriales cyanobacterium SM2_3_0]NJO47393.1 hypothetical protein [Oscillatoriales cyanobacterium RM2_1_1]
MKYFFLSDGWSVGRVWSVGGLWDEAMRRRPPDIQRLGLSLWDKEEQMWLYRAEDAVLMIEVKLTHPEVSPGSGAGIGQVVLTRLITADQVLERLCTAGAECYGNNALNSSN